jgi:hypothetical protein
MLVITSCSHLYTLSLQSSPNETYTRNTRMHKTANSRQRAERHDYMRTQAVPEPVGASSVRMAYSTLKCRSVR